MTLASDISTTSTSLSDIKNAIIAKGVTPSGNITTYAAAIGQIGGGKYKLLDRIKDDSNNEIGTVSGFFTDSNNVEYAVVCLDAQYRNASLKLQNTSPTIPNLPYYTTAVMYSAKETATENCNLVLAATTSPAISHCRSKVFTIDGTTYYGQVPNMVELIDILRRRIEINAADTTASQYSSLVISNLPIDPVEDDYGYYFSSTAFSINFSWVLHGKGDISYMYPKTSTAFVAPVLELPNQ